MADYPISKAAVIKELTDLRNSLGCRYIGIGLSMALQRLDGFPQMDVVPVVHARWQNRSCGYANCSRCGWEHPEKDKAGYYVAHNYCPNCGAKMDGGTEE